MEEGGFERAALRLSVTQSAVSQRLRALEAQVGTVLLVRSRPIKPTSAGRLLIKHAMQMRLLRADLETDLRNALANETMDVYFQPLVNTRTRKVSGYETLLRWNRPGHGLVSPAMFITCAEETGIILPLGERVLRMACRQMKSWLDAGHDVSTIAVNLSARQFHLPDIDQIVSGILHNHGGHLMRPDLAALPPRYLRTKEAADFLSLSARTLEKHRTYGTGPAYHKLGGRVVYSVEDLAAWVARGAVTSTSDPRGQVLPAKPLPQAAFTSPKRITR